MPMRSGHCILRMKDASFCLAMEVLSFGDGSAAEVERLDRENQGTSIICRKKDVWRGRNPVSWSLKRYGGKATGNAWKEMHEFGRTWFTALARPRVSVRPKIVSYFSAALLESCEVSSWLVHKIGRHSARGIWRGPTLKMPLSDKRDR